jgi:hypothetical protein
MLLPMPCLVNWCLVGKADPDLRMKPRIHPEDGFEYYSYVLIYVDDILAISHEAVQDLNKIDYY